MENNIHDPQNIKGMIDILKDDDEVLDIDRIEKSIIEGPSFQRDDKQVDFAREYNRELEQLSKQLLNPSEKYSVSDDINFMSHKKSQAAINDFDNILNSTTISSQLPPPKSKLPVVDDTNEDDEDADNTDWNATSSDTLQTSQWSASKPNDAYLSKMTNEERKQSHINKVLGTMDKSDDDAKFLQQEEEEDEMARIMEHADLLRTNLENQGVDLSRIPDVNANTTKKEAKAILRILQLKNDRLRYCDMFEEGILAMAYGLESMFDGKKEIFGSRIDLTGWSESVKVKLHRMRYDTSSFVSDVMKGYNISHGWRILFELLPSLFLYSRDRRLKSGDNIISDERYKEAIRNIGT